MTNLINKIKIILGCLVIGAGYFSAFNYSSYSQQKISKGIYKQINSNQ